MKRGPDKQFDREQVLEAAMATFWAHGCEATGVSELLKAMGIGRQSLYDTFGDKRSLYKEAMRHYRRTRLQPMFDVLRGPGSPMENLRTLFLNLTSMPGSMPGHGCFLGNTLAELGRHDPEINAMIQGYLAELEKAFTEVLDRARAAGELGSGLPTSDLAQMLVNTVQGLALLGKLGDDPARAGAVIKTALSMLEGK